MAKRRFGSIEGVNVGDGFASRRALSESRGHLPSSAGICGTPEEGAESVVVSGGYEDDEDRGDVIITRARAGATSGPASRSPTRS